MTLSDRDRAITLIGILLALFLAALDQTIVATALPRIVEDLSGLDRYAWVATAYLLASTALVPIYGKLADMYSRRAIELWAVGLFLFGSVLCGLAGKFGDLPLIGDGMNQLVAFRGVQGMGAAGIIAMTFIVIADLFPPAERGKYQGLVGAVFGIASVLGPLVGGFLTDNAGGVIPGVEGWRWVFYVNVPIGGLALWFLVTRMPALEARGGEGGERHALDYVSAILLIGGLVPFILALQLDKLRYPWWPTLSSGASGFVTVGLLAGALISLAAFVARTRRVRNPVFDLALFKNRVFSMANLAGFFSGAVFMSLLIFLPLFIVQVVGVSATRAGMSLVPLSFGIVFGSVVAGQLVSRIGHYRLLLLGGGLILFVGVMLLSQMSADVGYWRVTAYMLICGVGVGPSLPLYTLSIQNAVDVRQLGQATSGAQFFRQLGGTVGAAIMGTVLVATLISTISDAPSGDPLPVSPARLAATGGVGVEREIRAAFDLTYLRLQRAVVDRDVDARVLVLDDPQVPERYKNALREYFEGDATNDPERVGQEWLGEIRTAMDRDVNRVAMELRERVRHGIATAVTRIYFYAMFLVAAAWTATIFLPELPLRKTHDGGGS